MKTIMRLLVVAGVLVVLANCGGGGGGGGTASGATACKWDQSTSKWDNCTYGS